MSAPSKFKTKAQLKDTVEPTAFAAPAEPEAEPKRSGKVYTFYSFKGGVGRSMAMANIATLIASEGRKVLVVDWDLEAPGLEHYFFKHDSGLAERMKDSLGVIDLLTPDPEGNIADWRRCITQIKMRDVQLDYMQSGKRTRSSEVYTSQVQGLDWQALYDQHEIGARFDQIRQEWLLEYDFVFLDSRTGVTDIGDLCTVVLPDHLVLLFVTNTQNVQGIKDIYSRVQTAHEHLPADRLQLTALPLLSRDEFYSEHAQSSQWRRQAAEELAEIYEAWLPDNVRPQEAIQKLFVPYYAIWSFGEALPVMDDPDAIDNPASINAAFSRVSHLILNDLNWRSLDALSNPDAGGQAIKAQAALEERQAELEAEFKVREQQRRQAMGIGMLSLFAVIIGATYWIYSSSKTEIDQERIAAIERAKEAETKALQARADAAKQIARLEETQKQLSDLQRSVDQQLKDLIIERDQLLLDKDALTAELESRTSVNAQLRGDAKVRMQDLATAERRLATVADEIAKARKAVSDLRNQLARAGEAIDNLTYVIPKLAREPLKRPLAALTAPIRSAQSASDKSLGQLEAIERTLRSDSK
ncbi:MAG: AAA family ATPase [Pseudomonadota bacterium]